MGWEIVIGGGNMEIKLVALVCEKGSGHFNEDIASSVGMSAYVLDGATGLNGKNLVSSKSDANWLVNFWDDYLHHHVNEKRPIKEIVRSGIVKSYKEYKSLLQGKETMDIDHPSAAVAIVRLVGEKLEYFILGDCSIVTKEKDKLKFYMDQRITTLDNGIYKKMKALHEQGVLDQEKVKALLMNDIISNRLQKNTIDGYWVLEFVSGAVDKGISGEIDVRENMEIALMTDGFSAIVDKYHLVSTTQAFEEGIEKAMEKLRSFEQEDVKAVKIPRFKVMDDASCIHLKIVDK